MGENKTKEKKQNTTHKKALLASSEGVLALAFNGLPMAQQSHSNLRVSGLWVAVCLDKSRSSWFVLPQLLLIPLGSSCDQSDPCFGRLNYLKQTRMQLSIFIPKHNFSSCICHFCKVNSNRAK